MGMGFSTFRRIASFAIRPLLGGALATAGGIGVTSYANKRKRKQGVNMKNTRKKRAVYGS